MIFQPGDIVLKHREGRMSIRYERDDDYDDTGFKAVVPVESLPQGQNTLALVLCVEEYSEWTTYLYLCVNGVLGWYSCSTNMDSATGRTCNFLLVRKDFSLSFESR